MLNNAQPARVARGGGFTPPSRSSSSTSDPIADYMQQQGIASTRPAASDQTNLVQALMGQGGQALVRERLPFGGQMGVGTPESRAASLDRKRERQNSPEMLQRQELVKQRGIARGQERSQRLGMRGLQQQGLPPLMAALMSAPEGQMGGEKGNLMRLLMGGPEFATGMARNEVAREGLDVQRELGQGDLDVRRELGQGGLDVQRQVLGLDERRIDVQENLGERGLAVQEQEQTRLAAADAARQALAERQIELDEEVQRGNMSRQDAQLEMDRLTAEAEAKLRGAQAEEATARAEGERAGAQALTGPMGQMTKLLDTGAVPEHTAQQLAMDMLRQIRGAAGGGAGGAGGAGPAIPPPITREVTPQEMAEVLQQLQTSDVNDPNQIRQYLQSAGIPESSFTEYLQGQRGNFLTPLFDFSQTGPLSPERWLGTSDYKDRLRGMKKREAVQSMLDMLSQ